MATVAQLQTEFERMISKPEFGEDIVYVAGGTEYPIRAKVYRKGSKPVNMRFDRGTESQQSNYDVEIRISGAATTGRQSIAAKSDFVKIAKDIGGQVITMQVMEILDQDPGTWRLGLAV